MVGLKFHSFLFPVYAVNLYLTKKLNWAHSNSNKSLSTRYICLCAYNVKVCGHLFPRYEIGNLLKKEPVYHCPLTYSMSGPEKWTPYGLFCPASLTAHIVLHYSKSLLLTTMRPGCAGLLVVMAII